MREFFQGWKRKVGCVALVLACVSLRDWIVVHSDPKTRGTSFEILLPKQTIGLTLFSAWLLLSKQPELKPPKSS